MIIPPGWEDGSPSKLAYREEESAGQFFHDLLDLIVPDGGTVALLAAYFDASRMESGVFCVGGFAFGRDRAKKAERAWRRLWGDTICRMADLHSRKPGSAFADWTSDQAGQRLEDCVLIINEYASYAVCVSCDLPEIEGLAPRSAEKGSEIYLDGFRRAYATCCHLAMAVLGNIIRENSGVPAVAYFFESGDQYQTESQRFIALASNEPLLKEMYCHKSHTVSDKPDARLLETADIIAWEWAKHQDRVRDKRHMRPSLLAMLDPGSSGLMSRADFGSTSRRAVHVTGEPLQRYFDKVKHLVLS
jgi:hypothetical protein